ncbi:hypothetical protein N7463_009761 [Penicillium fimorum]|uniref:Uncharacterized protein n=1 Tax=Penicillium fimorum TaxID=1882269 RepID=A0A9X0C159_9EURO|nr:hypothetical protein N7463_009761 [Penicillium fimorum]
MIWVVEEDAHRDWAPDELTYLLDVDKRDLHFHYTVYSKTKVTTENVGRRGRIVFGKSHMKTVLEEELKKFSGKLLLSVSAAPSIRDQCRSFALRQGGKVDYFEHEFQPPKLRGPDEDKVPIVV